MNMGRYRERAQGFHAISRHPTLSQSSCVHQTKRSVKPVLFGFYESVIKGACMLNHVWLFATTWTVAYQAPLFMGLFWLEYWSGFPFPPPGDLPTLGSNLRFLHWQSDSLPLNYITTGIRLIKSLALGNQVNLQPLFSPRRCVCFGGLKVPTCLSCDWFPWQSAPLLLCPSPAFQRSSSLHKLRCGWKVFVMNIKTFIALFT